MKLLLTGGTGGIGEAILSSFAKDEHQIAFTYFSQKEKAEELAKKYRALPVFMDYQNNASIEKTVETVTTQLGGLDAVVQNAGCAKIALLQEMTQSEITQLYQTDLIGVTLLDRLVIPHFVKQQSGKIVHIGSVWGRVGASCEAVYSSAKAGIRGLTMSLAKELGPSHITVNCVEPGVIDTKMNHCFSPADMKELENETPLGRIGQPSDVANLVSFLISNQADFITGQCIGVDGGFGL